MSLPRYPKYKDSGVEWLGEVPEHWGLYSLRYHLKAIFNGVTADQTDAGEDTVPVTRIETISKGVIDFEKVGYIAAANARPDRLLVLGDILFSNINSLSMIGNCAQYTGDDPIYAGMNLLVLRPNESVNCSWFFWLIKAPRFREEVESLAKPAINQASVSQTSIRGISIATPTPEEQCSIAVFLDRETAKIDALVDEQRRLIELLKEKRQAVISHAVTKGLNPDAPMKDSGIEWLGKVPEHWLITRLKRVVEEGESISYGIVQPGDPQDDGVPFVQTTNMSSGTFELDALQRTTAQVANAYPRSQLHGGEVILGIRASIGAAYVVPERLIGANLSRGVARIACSSQISSTYLVCVFRSCLASHYWQLSKQGSTFNEVSIDTVREITLALPPVEEQSAIVAFLDRETLKLNDLTAEATRAIDLLQERRTALISAAVTGKIDVRGMAKEQTA
jgi:type I restriction enzyme S subunit